MFNGIEKIVFAFMFSYERLPKPESTMKSLAVMFLGGQSLVEYKQFEYFEIDRVDRWADGLYCDCIYEQEFISFDTTVYWYARGPKEDVEFMKMVMEIFYDVNI